MTEFVYLNNFELILINSTNQVNQIYKLHIFFYSACMKWDKKYGKDVDKVFSSVTFYFYQFRPGFLIDQESAPLRLKFHLLNSYNILDKQHLSLAHSNRINLQSNSNDCIWKTSLKTIVDQRRSKNSWWIIPIISLLLPSNNTLNFILQIKKKNSFWNKYRK